MPTLPHARPGHRPATAPAGRRWLSGAAAVSCAMLTSKLPDVGVSIFTQMSALAQQTGAINLAQGFPDYAPPLALREALARHALAAGSHQYAPMPGLPRLRQAIAAQLARRQPTAPAPDPEAEITITAGATEALYGVLAAVVRPGDEVLILEPAYDLYGPAVRLQGGVPRYVRLPAPHFRPDWAAVRAACSARTRLLLVNSPHNPSGAVFDAADWEALADLADELDALVLSDEVYEHLVFDGVAPGSTRGCGRGASCCRRLAKPTTPPAGKWATAWPRPPSPPSCGGCISSSRLP